MSCQVCLFRERERERERERVLETVSNTYLSEPADISDNPGVLCCIKFPLRAGVERPDGPGNGCNDGPGMGPGMGSSGLKAKPCMLGST